MARYGALQPSGLIGNVSAANSLVGERTTDFVSANGIARLPDGGYAVPTPRWRTDDAAALGAVTRAPPSGAAALFEVAASSHHHPTCCEVEVHGRERLAGQLHGGLARALVQLFLAALRDLKDLDEVQEALRRDLLAKAQASSESEASPPAE